MKLEITDTDQFHQANTSIELTLMKTVSTKFDGTISVGDETEVIEPLNFIPDTFDVAISLQSPLADNGTALVEVANQNFTLTNSFGNR